MTHILQGIAPPLRKPRRQRLMGAVRRRVVRNFAYLSSAVKERENERTNEQEGHFGR